MCKCAHTSVYVYMCIYIYKQLFTSLFYIISLFSPISNPVFTTSNCVTLDKFLDRAKTQFPSL